MGTCTSCKYVAVFDGCSAFAHAPLWNARGSLEGSKDMGMGEVLSKYQAGTPDEPVGASHSQRNHNRNRNGNGNGNDQASCAESKR